MEIEKRSFDFALSGEDEKRSIGGYGSVFGLQSENLGGFREIIAEGAFDGRLNDDVRALINHDDNLILGRTVSGTLRLSVDAKGLHYDVDLPETSYANDLNVSVKRGDITQSSFAFTVDDDEWIEEDGEIIRIIRKVKRLFDVSPVTYPAYPDATVSARCARGLKDFVSSKKELRDLLKQNQARLEEIRSPKWAR